MAASVLGTPVAADNGSTYTAESGSNRVLVFVGGSSSDGAKTVTSITFGGVAMTQAAFLSSDIAGYECNSGLWYIKEESIPSGSQTLSITWSGGLNNSSGCLMTLGGIDQTASMVVGTATGDANSGSPANPLSSSIAVAAGDLGVFGAVVSAQYFTLNTPAGTHGTYTEHVETYEASCSTAASSCVYTSGGAEQPTITFDAGVVAAVLVVFKEATSSVNAPRSFFYSMLRRNS
jgi:hypothetical protein